MHLCFAIGHCLLHLLYVGTLLNLCDVLLRTQGLRMTGAMIWGGDLQVEGLLLVM